MHGVDVDEAGNGTVSEPRLYQLIRQQGSVADRTFELTFLDPRRRRIRVYLRLDMPTPTDNLVVAEVVASEPEAELLCSLLRSAAIKCATRLTNYGAGASDGMPQGGPHEVLVLAEDLPAAREVLGRGNASAPERG